MAQKKIKKIKRQIVPLKGSFMVTAILGFLLSHYYILPLSYSLGIASMVVFLLMFIASIVSMTKAPLVTEEYSYNKKTR